MLMTVHQGIVTMTLKPILDPSLAYIINGAAVDQRAER